MYCTILVYNFIPVVDDTRVSIVDNTRVVAKYN